MYPIINLLVKGFRKLVNEGQEEKRLSKVKSLKWGLRSWL